MGLYQDFYIQILTTEGYLDKLVLFAGLMPDYLQYKGPVRLLPPPILFRLISMRVRMQN